VPVNPDDVIVSVQDPELPASICGGETGPQTKLSGGGPMVKVIAPVVWERDPMVPVTVTVNVPVKVELQLRVAVCGDVPKVTLAGRVHVKPAGVDADTERLTVPVSPFTAATVIVEVPELPVGI
jgi:hypothetical protein